MPETNAATIAADPTVQINPLSAVNAGVSAARNVTDLRTSQFNLQQSQLQPAYQAMRMLAATNPNPTNDDINAALGGAARIGGNVDGVVQNLGAWTARGGKPADFVRAYALGGMSPENQARMGVGDPASVSTGAGTMFGMRGGSLSASPGQFQPNSFVAQGFTPAEAAEFISVPDVDANGRPTGTTHMVPRGTVFGTGVPGSGGPAAGGGGSGGGGGGQPAGPPPGSSAQPGQPLSQKDADLARFSQRESGNQNIFSNVPVPGYTKEQTGSGYYQIIPSTWAQGQEWAGIPPNQRTQLAIQASPQQQYQVASALYDRLGGQPWARSAPQGQGGGGGGPPASGPFIGATSAQPVTGAGGPANVQPVGGMQYFSPTGQPMGQGGGGGVSMPGVQRGPGGAPILTPPSPYLLPQYEQGAKDYVRDQSIDKTLGQRIAPLQSAIGLVKDNPGLVTGQSAENWYQWVQGLATATGVNVGDVHNAAAYQELVKELGRNLLNNGADPTDMARLMREASQPNPTTQGRQALVTLAAEQIGYERIKSMQYREFRARHPNDANNNSQFYNQETGDFASDLDPKAVAADLIPQAELASYVRGLSPDAQKRFGQTLKDASRLFKFKIPE